MATLPTLLRTLDDDFVNTWYEIRPEVTDNILQSTILNLALREHGCLKPQVGGEYVTRTIGYGTKSIQAFSKGSVLTQSVPKLDTLAMWDWRYFLIDVTRSFVDDMKNAGTFQIKDYLARRISNARDCISQDMETDLFRWGAYTQAPYHMNGIYDICPNYTAESAVAPGSASDSQASGTSNGKIDRSANAWWRNWVAYDDATASDAAFIAGPTNEPYAENFSGDLVHMFNKVNANQEAPNFIIADQDIYESYEYEVSDRHQIVRTGFDKLAADLGFVTFTFKGATMTYSSKLASSKHVFLLNLNHINLVYHPNAWFDVIDWMTTPNQLERVMYIVCMTTGLITDQPRRHGVMEYAS